MPPPGGTEPPVRYHPGQVEDLTCRSEPSAGTVSGGQFSWGGCLLKSNGGVQRYPQAGRKSAVEYKGRRVPDCETDRSSRGESRA